MSEVEFARLSVVKCPACEHCFQVAEDIATIHCPKCGVEGSGALTMLDLAKLDRISIKLAGDVWDEAGTARYAREFVHNQAGAIFPRGSDSGVMLCALLVRHNELMREQNRLLLKAYNLLLTKCGVEP